MIIMPYTEAAHRYSSHDMRTSDTLSGPTGSA